MMEILLFRIAKYCFCLLMLSASVWATAQKLDFDGDGITDYVVVRTQSGTRYWYIINSATGTFSATAFGGTTNFEAYVPEDYDGDGKTDIAIYRANDTAYCNPTTSPANTNRFYILRSTDGGVSGYCWGNSFPSNQPTVTMDYDGDGKADPTVMTRAGAGTSSDYFVWKVLGSSVGAFTIQPVTTGTFGNQQSLRGGDFDGDGAADAVVWDVTNNNLIIRQSSTNTNRTESISGSPVFGDFNGDGKTDIATFARYGITNGIEWTIKNSTTPTTTTTIGPFGIYDNTIDSALVGDFDGDGKTDVGVVRNKDGYGCPTSAKCFFASGSTAGFIGVQWGLQSDYDFRDGNY